MQMNRAKDSGSSCTNSLDRIRRVAAPSSAPDEGDEEESPIVESTPLNDPRSAQAWGELGMVLGAHELHADARECLAQAARLLGLNQDVCIHLFHALVRDGFLRETPRGDFVLAD